MAIAPQHYAFASVLFSLLLFLATCYSRYDKLKHIPGPFLASFTDFWRAYYQNAGDYTATALQLHAKYGPVVRIGPNTVHVSDATALPSIYTNHGEFKKADSYGPMRVPTALGHSIGSVIDMQNEAQNTALKRGVGSAFTSKAVLSYQSSLNNIAIELMQTITLHPIFDLFKTLQFFQLDFLTQIAFSESFGHLRERKDVWGMAKSTEQRIAHWVQWQSMPTLEYYLIQHPFWCKYWKTPTSSSWAREALEQLGSRLETAKDYPTFTTPKVDLLQKYVDALMKKSDIDRETISLMTTSTIGAGFDTTAHAFTTILYYLITNPPVLAKLREELARTPMSQPIPHWDEVNKLPYLDAIIKEAMRCNPFLPVPLERVVPATGANICGKHLPPGTLIGAQAAIVHRDPQVFGHDVEAFKPERWIEASEEQRLAMERGSLGFGSGKRICLGLHIAEMELKKVVPALIGRFEMSLIDPQATLKSADGLTTFPGVIMVSFRDKKQGGAWEKRVA